jgi:hypothetical protein
MGGMLQYHSRSIVLKALYCAVDQFICFSRAPQLVKLKIERTDFS